MNRPQRKTRPARKPTARKPTAAQRRTGSSRPPTAVEAAYARALRREASVFGDVIRRLLLPKIAQFARPEPEQKLDAGPEDDHDKLVTSTMRAVRGAVRRGFDEVAAAAAGKTASDRLVKHSQSEFKRLGIDLQKDEPKLGKLVDKWRSDNVGRIKSVHEDQLDRVENILREGFGRRSESLAKDLAERIDVTESKAELIARDQTLTLFAQITQERHAAAGIERFVWTTANDERVRPEHEELDGQEFAYDDPPELEDGPALPGEPPLCRCVAYPVLPELAEDQ